MASVVEVAESGLVLPSEETPKGSLWLSNLDIPLASRHHTPLIYVYRPNGNRPADFTVLQTLKTALSKALVPFYPIAGRLCKGQDGRLEISCNGEGVLFVVARCEASMDEFGEFVPSPELSRMFVPAVPVEIPTILFMVQGGLNWSSFLRSAVAATGDVDKLFVVVSNAEGDEDGSDMVELSIGRLHDREDGLMEGLAGDMHRDGDGIGIAGGAPVTILKDGAVILGTAFHHVVADGFGAVNLIKTWSYMARGVPELALPPFHDRTLLRARSPPTVLFEHMGNKSIIDTSTLIKSPTTTVIIKMSRSRINLLKNNNTKPFSAFQVVTAHLWRCTCIARRLAPDQETRLYFPVGARNRLRPPLPANFFGNVICRKAVAVKVKELISDGLEFAAKKIREETAKVTDEYMRSLIDMLEVSMHSGVIALPVTDFAVISWLGMPVYDADFGWGDPEFVRTASLSHCGYAYIMESPRSEGEICALVSVETGNMERFLKAFYEDLN